MQKIAVSSTGLAKHHAVKRRGASVDDVELDRHVRRQRARLRIEAGNGVDDATLDDQRRDAGELFG